MADIPRQPIYVKYWPRPWPQAEFYYRVSSIQLLRSIYPPINQEIWSLPIQPSRVYAQSYSSPYALIVPPPIEKPVAQTDWPRPLIVTFRATIWQLNPSIALITARTLIPPQYDYPLPPQLQTSISIRTWIQQGIKEAPLAVPFSQSSWPLPQRPPIVYAQSYSTPYALTVVVVVNPFSQTDWPTPKQPPRIYAQARHAFPPLLHSVYPPINLEIWPPPIQPHRVYAQNYSTNFQLLSSIAPPNRLSDWPQIIQPYRVYARSYAPSLALTFVQPVPFVQSNWPNPIEPYRVYAQNRRADIRLIHSIKPFTQTDWPRAKLTFGGKTWTQGPVALQLQQPFAQDDWPTPIQPYRVYAIVRRADIGLLHSIQPPNEQSAWPVPTQPPRVYAKSHGIPGTLLTPPAVPINQDTWPTPTPPPRVYAETRRADIGLLRSIKPPNRQIDWPLPKLVRRLGETIAQPPHLAMLAKPFNQPDWPNPKQVLLPTSAQGWINRVNLALQIAALPNNQFDWPIPKPSRLPNDRRTYVQAAPILLGIPEQPKPIKQDQWPIPIQPVFPFWTRQFGQGAWPTIGLVPPPLPPVPRIPTEQRFRSPLQDDDTRPDVPDQRRPGVSAIRRQPNESPSSARDKSWRYE
jgi:hypothetical protein